MAQETIKVRVTLSVTIDLAAYREAYGEDDVATIRRDIVSATADALREGAVLADSIVDVTALGRTA